MSTIPDPAAPNVAPDLLAEDAAYYRRVLHELIDMGTDLARALHQQGTAPASGESDGGRAPDVTVAFERVSRSIRRTILLARKVAEPAPGPALAARQRLAARRRVIRKVEDMIQREASEAEASALHSELLDRMDSPDLDDDIASRPVWDIIWEICEDMGVKPAFGIVEHNPRRTPEDIALLCERAAAAPGQRIARATPPPRAKAKRDPVFRPRVRAPEPVADVDRGGRAKPDG